VVRTRRAHPWFCLLLLLLCSMLPAHAADWPYYQHDAAHTGASNAIVNAAELTLAWSAPPNYSTPLIVGDTIYSTRNQGGFTGGGHATLISAFDLATGAIKWTYSVDFAFPSQAAVGGGLVVFHTGISGSEAGQLYVLDAITGALRYKVSGLLDIPSGVNVMPLLVPNPTDGTVTAYCATEAAVRGVKLGATSGSILWTQSGQFGGASMPTIVGNSIVLAGPGQFYSFDLDTGARNQFHQGTVHGGGGTTVAYDSARQHIYILELDSAGQALSAYRYTNNAQIEFLWQRTGPEIGYEGSVAIGPSGNVYAAYGSLLIEVDPDTGTILRSAPGAFRSFSAPAITTGMIWTFSDTQTTAYDLQTLQLVRAFPGAHFSTAYASPGAFADGYFLLDYGTIVGSRGFDVYAAPAAQPINLSTRMRVQVGDNVGIGGFIITGSAPKQVVLRGIGPSLTGFGVPDALADPVMELHGPTGFATITNDNWRDTQAATIQATRLAPTNDLESAILVTLNPGPYTAILKGKNNTAGVALVEVYDLDQTAASKLGNISTRAFVDTGDNLVIVGFILGGNAGYDHIIVRGIGPSLSASGVPNALTNPALELRDSNGALIIQNDNWQNDPSQAAIISAAGLAPTNALESAIAATLPPGLYTALLAGVNNGTGIGVVEVYDRGAP
jgi:outer membrane protein assembly factor BamB